MLLRKGNNINLGVTGVGYCKAEPVAEETISGLMKYILKYIFVGFFSIFKQFYTKNDILLE